MTQEKQPTAPVQRRRRQPKLIPKNIQKQIHQHPNLKYRLIGLIMLQCGARPGEAASLQIKDFDFVENRVRLRTLKRKDGHERWVKMRRETLVALEAYWKELKDKAPNAYLFPPVQRMSRKPHLQRKQVSRYFRKHFRTNAHRCRHTFASEVLAEVHDVYKVKELLGHKSVKNTEIYLHVAQVDLDNAVIAAEKWTLWQRLYQKVFPRKPILFTPVENGLTKFHVGRKEELTKLATLIAKKVNVLLIGDHGTGKSHLLQNIPDTKKTILRMDDLLSTKKRIQGLLLELFGRKPAKFEMLFAARFEREGFNEEGLQLDEISEKEKAKDLAEELMRRKEEVIGKVISRDSITNLIDLCTKVCEPMEYTLIIDDITNVGRPGVLALEKLKNHFHIIAACRRLKIDKKTAVTNFQHIQLQNLQRHEAIDLIQKLTYPFIDRIEDYELYKNHIWEQTAGNPLYMYELIDRYRKEGYVTTEITRDISHTSGMKEVDLFPVIIGLVACLSALRYMAKATGGDSGPFYLIAGLGMIALFFGRALMQAGKRKWI